MSKLYILIGVPAAGKSTWVSKQEWAKDCAYISTDTHVDSYAAANNTTYNDVFKAYMPTAIKLMTAEVLAARAEGKDIIWDQTNVSVASRAKKFNMLPDYTAIAVVFPTPEANEHARRLDSREGKHIPYHVITQMIKSFEYPTLEEGFSSILVAQ